MKAKYSHKESKGLPGGPNEVFSYVTGIFSTDGYRSDSQDVNNPFNIIPSGNITMKERDGTPLRKGPLLGIDNLGNEQMMYPGMDYQFPGNEVTEWPMAQDGLEYEDLELTDEEIKELRDGGYVVEELPKAQEGIIHVTDPNDPGYIANKDSADVFQKQQQFNSQFLSNFPSIPIPAGDKSFIDFDLMEIFRELKAKAGDPANSEKDRKAFVAGAEEVWKSMLAAPKTVDEVIGPWSPRVNNDSYKEILKKYERNMQGQGVTTPTVLRSGNYIPNSEANWLNTDNSPHKQNVIKRGLGYGQNYSVNTIDPYTEYEWEGKNWLTGKTALNKSESHGLSHNEVKHPTIKPIGHMRWHAALPGSRRQASLHEEDFRLEPRPGSRAASGFNSVDPESTLSGYEDANFYNISLPYYKAPVLKYILDKPPVVNTTPITIPKPRSESSFKREKLRDETEDLMEELRDKGLYDGPIRGRGADKNEEWQEALAKYENKEVVSSTPKTLKKFTEPKTPEGYTLKTGYRGRDGIYYGNKYLPTTSKGKTHPVPGAPTMQDYWIKYPNERPKDKDLVSKQIGGELPMAQTGEETEPNMVHRNANWAAKVRAGLPIEFANYNDDQIRELYENQNIVGAEPYGDEMIASFQLPELEILPGRQHELPYYKDLPEHTKQIIRESNIPTPPEVIAEYGYDPWSYKHNPMLRSALQTASDGPFNLYDRLVIPAMIMQGVAKADQIYRVPQALGVEAYEAYHGRPYDFSNVNPFTETNKSNMRRPSDIMEGGKQLDKYGQEELSWSGLAADVLADPFIISGANKLANRGIQGLRKKLVSNVSKKRYTNASKNAKFFDDFERNVDDVFNKGPEATWYDDVATTADDVAYTPRSLKAQPIAPLLESSDMHFDRALGKILEKDSPYLTRNFNAAEFVDDMSGLRVEPRVLDDVYPLYHNRSTKHFSGTGAGAHSGSGDYNTMFLGNIDDIKNASGAHLRDVSPTDTYFYNTGDNFKLTPEGVYITGDKETYNKLLQTNKRVRYSPELFRPDDYGTSQSANLDFLNLRNREEVLKSFDDYKRAQGMGSILEATDSRKFFPSSFNSSAIHSADIISMLENPQHALTGELTRTLDPKVAAEYTKIHNQGLQDFKTDWTTYNQWKNLPENIQSNEIKKLDDFYRNELLKGKIDYKQYDWGDYKGITDNPITQQRFNDDYKNLIGRLKNLKQDKTNNLLPMSTTKQKSSLSKGIDVSEVAPPANSKSSGEFNWDDYRLNLVESQFPDQKIISMPDDALEVYMKAHDIKEPLPVLKHNTNYINNLKNLERKEWSDKQVKKYRDDSEKAFQEGVDLVDTWAYKDKAGYDKAVKAKDDLLNEVDALDIKFIDNESPEVSKFKDLLRKQLKKENEGMYKGKVESNPYLRTEDEIKRKWTTDRERARQIIIDSSKDGINDPDVVKGAKIYYDKITKERDLKLAASKIDLHEFVDPDFKEKAEVLAALSNPPSNKIFNPNRLDKPNQLETDIIPDTRDRSKLIQVDENDPSFKNLSEYDKNYLRENKDRIGGVRTSNSTITIGGRTQKNKFLALPTQKVKVETLPLSLKDPSTWKNVLNRKVLVDQPITEKDAQVIELIEDVFEKHDGIREIAAHEGGHDLQKYKNWLQGVTRYSPEFKYKVNRAHQDLPEDPINQLLNETMVEPTLPLKGGDNTTETWLSGFGELHSEMMTARTKIAYQWMKEYKLSLDEAVKGIKQLEKEGDEDLFKWYFRKEDGNLGKHFKKDAPWGKIKKTLMYAPAVGSVIAGVSAKEEMKDGGEYEEMELTPFEITELRARGHRVDVM